MEKVWRISRQFNLLDEFGLIEINEVKAQARTFYSSKISRASQDDTMLFNLLMNSISSDGKKKVMGQSKDYKIGPSYSGICLLKVIVGICHIDTNASNTVIRMNLTNLDRYMVTVSHDIIKFNEYVAAQVTMLSGRGEKSQDLLVNLFKGYNACADRQFNGWLLRKNDEYEEGTGELKPRVLMQLAKSKYQTIMVKGQWQAPTADDKQLQTLTAEIRKLKGEKKKFPKPPPGGGRFKEKEKKKRPKDNQKPEWMASKPPPDKMTAPRTWKDKPWYWCGAATGGKCDPPTWRCHKPGDCKGMAFTNKFNKKKKGKVTINEALNQEEQTSDGFQSE